VNGKSLDLVITLQMMAEDRGFIDEIDWLVPAKEIVIEQPFNNYFSFCPCLLLFGFVDDIIKGQQHESDFISFYLCLSLFGHLLSLISYLLSSYLLSPYFLISPSYPIGRYLDHILLVDKSWLV